MGFGKTLMTIACMVNGYAASTNSIKTTLLVATPPLVGQWMKELKRMCGRISRKDEYSLCCHQLTMTDSENNGRAITGLHVVDSTRVDYVRILSRASGGSII